MADLFETIDTTLKEETMYW